MTGPFTKEKDTLEIHKRGKPSGPYKQLFSAFQGDKSLHGIDACSGAGSCSVAYLSTGVKCVILDKSQVKVRLIRQW